MKLTFILLTVCLLQVSATGFSQNVTISVKDASIEKVFKKIQRQTGMGFLYSKDLLQNAGKVSMDVKNAPVVVALSLCFNHQPLDFSIKANTIIISAKYAEETAQTDTPASKALANITVHGIVTDEDGKPLEGVSVLVKGSTKGTTTNSSGAYEMEVDKSSVLIFSRVGYVTIEKKAKDEIINLQLKLFIKPLDEMIVGGNMAATKRIADVTSVTVIDSKTLERLPVNTIDQIFRGLVPGTNNFQPSSAAGTGYPTLTIRGASSPSSISAIAVYIDGVEYANGSWYLENLDKNNIDRIEVVRGPGAATLYGTGSNGGIVQIFTKKSKTGQSTVNLTTSAGFYKSKWVKHDPFQQVQSLNITNGFKMISYSLGGTFRKVGAYLPDGDEKTHNTNGSVSFNLKKFSATIKGNYNYTDFGAIRDPSYDTVLHPINPGLAVPTHSSHKRNITESGVADLNINFNPTDNWMHNLVLGYSNNTSYAKPISNDTAIINSKYYYTKNDAVTLRYSNILKLGKEGNNLKATITSGGEYKNYSYLRIRNGITPSSLTKSTTPNVKNFGAFAQAVTSYKNVYLTGGLRFESNELFGKAWNPRLGITTNFNTGNIVFKPRISWGRGITSPNYVDRFGLPSTNPNYILIPNPDIKPQAQQGWDYGLEIFDKLGNFKMEVVRYNNVCG
jgi:outer membrane cobalamin receptor